MGDSKSSVRKEMTRWVELAGILVFIPEGERIECVSPKFCTKENLYIASSKNWHIRLILVRCIFNDCKTLRRRLSN